MIKKAMEYVAELAKPHVQEIGGQMYSDKALIRINHNPMASAIELTTLSSLVEYIKAGTDAMKDAMIIHIQSPARIEMYSALDYDRKRELVAKVRAMIPAFAFDKYMDHESFCIAVQSKFVPNDATDRDLILKFAGTVEAGTVAEYGDDGITQKATVKTGLASKGDAIIPNPVLLKPFRTFVEVEQPCSRFVFRMKQDKYDGIQCALFEADGGEWELRAMQNIKEYLKAQLEGIDGYVIIS